MKIFLVYFEMAIKITGSAQNYRVGRVSRNTPIFFLGLKSIQQTTMVLIIAWMPRLIGHFSHMSLAVFLMLSLMCYTI